MIEDGSTLQLGIGAIPDAVLLFMGDKKDLGIHTEMFSDGVIDLVESGVVNGSKKTLHPGKLVATFLMGTRRLYDFVDKNACVEMRPVDYVNDPRVIAQNEKMVSINSCIEVDLMGQVASETIGLKQFSGTGGQVDYVRGAAWSAGGKSIMAMPSTAAKGKASRIVPLQSPSSSRCPANAPSAAAGSSSAPRRKAMCSTPASAARTAALLHGTFPPRTSAPPAARPCSSTAAEGRSSLSA